MIASMTAFASQSEKVASGILFCDLRSVNHRYLEMSINLPEALHGLEPDLRQKIQNRLRRGKIEVTMRLHANEAESVSLQINQPVIKQLAKSAHTIADAFSQAGVNAHAEISSILSWPGLLHTGTDDPAALRDTAIQLFETTLTDCVTMRQQEGRHLSNSLIALVDQMAAELASIKAAVPEIVTSTREKILARFAELALLVDEVRIEQELVWLVQKMDMTEELERLEAHLIAVREALHAGGAVGKRLDFLMQELYREANTLNSKSTRAGITHRGVELKVLIEQMREQVQNIE